MLAPVRFLTFPATVLKISARTCTDGQEVTYSNQATVFAAVCANPRTVGAPGRPVRADKLWSNHLASMNNTPLGILCPIRSRWGITALCTDIGKCLLEQPRMHVCLTCT